MASLTLTIEDPTSHQQILNLDFSIFSNRNFAIEVMKSLKYKYDFQRVTVDYIHVLYIAAYRFDTYLKINSIDNYHLFYQYHKDDYKEYLSTLKVNGHHYSDKYIHFLVIVPGLIFDYI